MPLFDLSGDDVRPFRLLSAEEQGYESEIEELFWSNLEAFAGEPLFAVSRQARLSDGGIVDILALDTTGRIVVIEIKRDIDRNQLAQSLEYAGWAGRASLDDIAVLYSRGPDEFFTDWLLFTNTTTPMLLDRAPRLMLVSRSLDARTEGALQFLRGNQLPVDLLRVLFYEDRAGARIVGVDRAPRQRGRAKIWRDTGLSERGGPFTRSARLPVDILHSK